jgi:hypothetical protein
VAGGGLGDQQDLTYRYYTLPDWRAQLHVNRTIVGGEGSVRVLVGRVDDQMACPYADNFYGNYSMNAGACSVYAHCYLKYRCALHFAHIADR